MTLSERIAAHLPLLRRYARAITGSQASGDAYVGAVLEALIADISAFPETSSDRVSIYKMFTDIYSSSSIEIEPSDSPFVWEQQAARNLSRVSALPRQAFVLVSVESFSPDEAAEVLGVDEGTLSKLLDDAGKAIAEEMSTDIMIIEDEPLIAMDIEYMVSELGHKVTGIARTKDEALEMFRKTSPKMVLADIQLADGSSGIDAVNEILTSANIPVIFITAFPERLLTGERPEPTFLVTKPFDADMVKALISQALFFDERSAIAA